MFTVCVYCNVLCNKCLSSSNNGNSNLVIMEYSSMSIYL